MLSKLKSAFNQTREDESEGPKRRVNIEVMNGDEIKVYSKLMDQFKLNIEELEEISRTNKEDIIEFIKDQQEKVKEKGQEKEKEKEKEDSKQGEDAQEDEEDFVFTEDLKEIQIILKEVGQQLAGILAIESDIKARVKAIQENESADKVNELAAVIAKLEAENKKFVISQDNNKEIMNTLSQQTQLYLKELQELQEKYTKADKELKEKSLLAQNLTEEKSLLLEMRNNDQGMKNPEIEGLKAHLAEFDKRLTLEKTKCAQKEKEIDGLRKKLEEERESLEKVADQLKEKELKSKKILDKYERSKTEIRKYREEKTQFIKKLNIENADLNAKVEELIKDNTTHLAQVKVHEQCIENLETTIHKNENRASELDSIRNELVEVRKELVSKNHEAEDLLQQITGLNKNNQQLHAKRKCLLESLEKPVAHEIRTLEKIIKALERLYKEYITTVFEQGNVVGFETKITYLLSNIQEIKEDLLL